MRAGESLSLQYHREKVETILDHPAVEQFSSGFNANVRRLLSVLGDLLSLV